MLLLAQWVVLCTRITCIQPLSRCSLTFLASSFRKCFFVVVFFPTMRSFLLAISYPLVKPVLNWADVCSPNILRTVRRTMIRFLIVLLVRRTLLRSQLACNEMQASVRTCGRPHDQKCRLKSSQDTLIIPHRVIQLTTISFWVPETRLGLPQVNK